VRKKTTSELIQHLKNEAPHFKWVRLLVKFESFEEYIGPDDANSLEKLNEAVERGGVPVGLVGVAGDHLRLVALNEFRDVEWMANYCNKIVKANPWNLSNEDRSIENGWVN